MSLQKWSDDIWIKQLADRPGLTDDLEVVTQRYRAQGEPPHLMLDLSQVTAVGSGNLAQMLTLHKHAGDHGRRLKIASPSTSVWTVFLTASLDNVFEFSEDPAAGLADLQLGG